MTEIYLTISLSTHNGDDTPQNYYMVISLCIWRLQILGDHRHHHEPNQDKSLQP